jgi:hypothetical protein
LLLQGAEKLAFCAARVSCFEKWVVKVDDVAGRTIEVWPSKTHFPRNGIHHSVGQGDHNFHTYGNDYPTTEVLAVGRTFGSYYKKNGMRVPSGRDHVPSHCGKRTARFNESANEIRDT